MATGVSTFEYHHISTNNGAQGQRLSGVRSAVPSSPNLSRFPSNSASHASYFPPCTTRGGLTTAYASTSLPRRDRHAYTQSSSSLLLELVLFKSILYHSRFCVGSIIWGNLCLETASFFFSSDRHLTSDDLLGCECRGLLANDGGMFEVLYSYFFERRPAGGGELGTGPSRSWRQGEGRGKGGGKATATGRWAEKRKETERQNQTEKCLVVPKVWGKGGLLYKAASRHLVHLWRLTGVV